MKLSDWKISQGIAVLAASQIIIHAALYRLTIWHIAGLAICAVVFKRGKKYDGADPETGRVLFRKATKLERQFKTQEALAAYDYITARFAGQEIANDARISAENIRKNLGA